MYKLEVFDKQITAKLKKDDETKRASHTPSGKLSASGLGDPLQWQVLKTLGVGTRVVDDYVLRKFARGNDVEAWYLGTLEKAGLAIVKQELVEYRGVIGYVDALIETPFNGEICPAMPHEVKSVSNAKFKQIEKRMGADDSHKLQGGLYALAKGCPKYAITYIASDDYRTLSWVFDVAEVKGAIDGIIDSYDKQIAKQEVPVFVPKYAWQASLDYNKYPQWANLNPMEIKLALDFYHPGVWENYKNER